MKKINLIVAGLVGALTLNAQDFNSALRFSESFVEGDGRYMAMAGALSSLGGNVSAMSVNPASSASFKKSVFELSPAYIYAKSENYYHGYAKAFSTALKMPSMGLLYYKPMKQNEIFVSGISFGFSYNAQNRYYETLNFTNKTPNSSLTDDFLRLGSIKGSGAWDDFYEKLAWDTYLINFDEGTNTYYSDFVDKNGAADYSNMNQNIQIERDGQKNEYLFNIGVNFTEWVYFGADLTLTNMYYKETRVITETVDDNNSELNKFSYMEDYDLTGNGVGGKFGVIVRPIEYVRIGAAIHTPVTYSISEDGETSLDVTYNKEVNGSTSHRKPETYAYDYKIGQPAKFVGSLGFVYKNVANIGVDFESMNYSQCTFTSDDALLMNQSSQIADELKAVNNIKCGGEFRYGPFLFRAGYAMYGNPYKNVSGDKFYRNDYSAGVGLATNTVYCDLAWLRAKSKQTNDFYRDLKGNIVSSNSTIKRDNITFTIGFKF
ncbi:MAG: hypothetical protein IKP08_05955 [Bacteroidales bacterium]|nr:hypothetical protein [Bacteroidales bacterium]